MSKDILLSASMQDYLEAILEIEVDGNVVRITDIANKLKIAKASVNQTINKLKEIGLVCQKTYGPVELTEDGREMADRIIQRHRKLRQFLVEVLGVDSLVAEKDACLMEHAVSSQTMERLTEFLSKNGYAMEESYVRRNSVNVIKSPLSELKIGEKGIVVKVSSKGVVRRRIMEMGIITGTEILVKGVAPLGDPIELGIKGYSLSLRKSEAANILVELI